MAEIETAIAEPLRDTPNEFAYTIFSVTLVLRWRTQANSAG